MTSYYGNTFLFLSIKLKENIESYCHFVHAPSQWETTLRCNAVSYWLGAYTKRSLISPFPSHIYSTTYTAFVFVGYIYNQSYNSTGSPCKHNYALKNTHKLILPVCLYILISSRVKQTALNISFRNAVIIQPLKLVAVQIMGGVRGNTCMIHLRLLTWESAHHRHTMQVYPGRTSYVLSQSIRQTPRYVTNMV